jgi:LDH2 family malate/lactate/ureidoglycolate dehydrogenase
MAIYPGSDRERRIDAAALARIVRRVFEGCGMSVPDAELLADTLVRADLRGIHSHGTLRVPDYVKKLTADGVDPKGRPAIVSRRGAAIVVDARNAMGQIACAFAADAAIEAAREHGVALAAIRGSNHCGAMDYWAMRPLAAGMAGIAGTNALPTMAPWGGREKIVGINPLAVAVPGRTAPLVLDIAFGATAHGKIRIYAQKGEAIPEGWAFDASGRPTTDASAALEGLIQPIGQYKGVGLAVMVGILSSLLSGAAYGLESGDMIDGAKVGADGHFILVINVAAFAPLDAFQARVDKVAAEIAGSAPAVKGQLEARFEADYSANGIPLNAVTLDGVRAAAGRFGVPADALEEE